MNKRLVWNFEINTDEKLHLPEPSRGHEELGLWESRFFWSQDRIILLRRLDLSFLELSRYKVKHKEDNYCLMPDSDYNLKYRRNQLLYKPILSRNSLATAYGKKIVLENEHPNAQLPGSQDLNADTLIKQVQTQGIPLCVKKETLLYRFETVPIIKLELARLKINDTTYFSMSLESHVLFYVETLIEQIIGDTVPSDYVTFLKRISK